MADSQPSPRAFIIKPLTTPMSRVTHDFNNLLTVINGDSELLLDAVGDRAELREPVEEIYLPRIDARGGSDLGVAEAGVGHARVTETILLIEDDDAVRALAKRVLERCGYTVLAANRGTDGLRLASAHRTPIHLLITDVVMPGIAGRMVAEQIAESHPETKVLYLSGHTKDHLVRNDVLDDAVHFVQKPFGPAAIAHKVREVLSS